MKKVAEIRFVLVEPCKGHSEQSQSILQDLSFGVCVENNSNTTARPKYFTGQ